MPSLSLFSNQESKSQMNLPKDSKPISKELIMNSKKKNMKVVQNLMNLGNSFSLWLSSMPLF
jgi:hypothetical protein